MRNFLKVILTCSFILLLSSNPSDNTHPIKDSVTKIEDAHSIHLFNNEDPGR